MKKQYIIPSQIIVHLSTQRHLMDLSSGGTSSISSREADGDGFVKPNSSSTTSSNYNVWNDDWSK